MNSLGLKAGEWVEVRSREEILATLDPNASLEGMPFMPEMLRYCGRRLRVFKRAHKTCDTAEKTGGRRVPGTVHLEGVRCDGSGHGGCQAGCMIFWKEAWLKRASGPAPAPAPAGAPTDAVIERGAYFSGRGGPPEQVRWRCQANELFRASAPLPWWDFRQYLEDLVSRNIGAAAFVRGAAFSVYRRLIEIGVGYRALIRLWELAARLLPLGPFPMRKGTLAKTPTAELGLQPGEWVRVKSYPEILATLDVNNRNRGLFFDVEATKFCGRTFRVASRVTQILDEKTGEMLRFKNPCIVLEQVWCGGEMSKYRVFCPRAIYPYWREIWLERVPAPDPAAR
jgi:hypothetical protein